MGAKTKAAFALLALAVSACFATVPPSYTGANSTCSIDNFNQSSGNAPAFIAIAFAIVSFAIGLAYMYSKVREDAHLGVWAKDEAYNLLISLLLFAGVLAAFSASCSLAEGFVHGNPIQVSRDYLDVLIQSNGLNMIKSLTTSSLNNQLDATKYLYFGMTPFWGDGVAMKNALRAQSTHKEYIIDMYLPILASLTTQKYLVQAISWVGAYVLLPFAFVMRLVPFTREFGNVLLAFFFAFYIVVPTTYALSAQVFTEKVMVNPYQVEPGLSKFCSYGLDGSNCADQTQSVFYRIGSTIPQAIFLPNLSLIVGISCVMATWKALRALAV